MLRKIVNLIVRSTGWSVVGRRVRLLGGEGPLSVNLTGATGEVLQFRRREGMTSDVFILKLEHSIVASHRTITHVLLVPRHAGYSYEALAMTSICAYVFEVDPSLPEDLPPGDEMIAMMDVELIADSYKAKARDIDKTDR